MSNSGAINPAAVLVATRSPLLSKINWVQLLGLLFTLATAAGLTVPQDLQTTVITLATTAQALVTIVIKTWFTPTVTPQSVGK